MSEILFIRHAETDMAGTFCGHSDPELNARGRVQLAELVNKLRMEDIGVVYSSDLRRAHSTGMAVAEALNIDCHIHCALREINFGQWEGLTWIEIEQRDKAYAHRWVTEYPDLPAPDGENFRDFEQRVLDEVKFISRETESKGRNIAVITHAGVLRTVLGALHGYPDKDAWEWTRSYCSIVRHLVAPSLSLQHAEEFA
jgi:alpha-ribazole phosphatase